MQERSDSDGLEAWSTDVCILQHNAAWSFIIYITTNNTASLHI